MESSRGVGTALAMVTWRRHSERFAAGATALLLQATLYGALSERRPIPSNGASAPSLTARILTLPGGGASSTCPTMTYGAQ